MATLIFFLKLSLKKKIGCLQEPLAYYQVHDGNFSLKNLKLYIEEQTHWIKKNEKLFISLGLNMRHQKYFLYKLKIKYFLNTLGRVVQW